MTTDQDSNETHQEATSSIRYHVLGILVLSAIMYFLLVTATDDEVLDISRLLELQEQDYDYFMANVDSVHYTAEGVTNYRFSAERVIHFPNPDTSLMDKPSFQLFREDSSAWQIDSIRGRVETDPRSAQQNLVLMDNVIINGLSADGREVIITTDSITVYPQEQRLDTESDVTVTADGFSSTSTGLTADLKSNTIRQLSSGRLQYDN